MPRRRGRCVPLYAAVAVVTLIAAGCSGGPGPTIDPSVISAPPPTAIGKDAPKSAASAQAAPSASATVDGPQSITGFKKASVILYSSPSGADGQKVPAGNMPLPMPVRAESAGGGRLEVMTIEGLRWIARSDVVLAAAAH